MFLIDHDAEGEEQVLSQVLTAVSRQIEQAESLQTRREDEIDQWAWGLETEFKTDGSDVEGWLQAMQWVRNAEAGVGEAARRLDRLRRQSQQPYFGRVDFQFADEAGPETFRIGLFGLSDGEVPVYDWRAPIASLYYDAEPGPAAYEAPAGTVSGSLVGKRQYLIREGRLHGEFETTLPVGDDVLQGTLVDRPDHRMRSIVSTIQHQQNRAIRMPVRGNLLVEGPAGSGKTSVALQRLAYVLYREHKQLSAKNVLFLSPSRLFADYVSQVLPELGEENPILWGFEDLMAHLFTDERFQSRFDSLEETWSTSGGTVGPRLAYKASGQFVEDLERFQARVGDLGLPFRPIGPGDAAWIRPETLHRWFTRDLEGLPVHSRLDEIAQRLAPILRGGLASYRRRVRDEFQPFAATESELSEMADARLASLDRRIQTRVAAAGYVDWREAYRRFYRDETPARRSDRSWQTTGEETLAALATGPIPYEDQPGFLWLRASLAAERTLPDIRMLVIDEAQDYTPCQYAALARILPHARLTAVGDSRQVLSPGYGLTELDGALRAFVRPHQPPPPSSMIRLRTTYRSSPPVMAFACQLLPPDTDIEIAPLGRSDEAPAVLVVVRDPSAWARVAARLVDQARAARCARVGIITRTVREARERFWSIAALVPDAILLDSPESPFMSGVVVLPLMLAKGLEFDAVLIADASESAYQSEHDRLLLYTAVTRAIRRLWLIALGSVAPWMPTSAAFVAPE